MRQPTAKMRLGQPPGCAAVSHCLATCPSLDILTVAHPEPSAQARPGPAAWRWAAAVALVAVVARLVPAVLAYGTSDVMTWELLGRMLLSGENFYATQLHNWPVLWIYFCAAAALIHDATGLPFFTLIKLPPIAADAAMTILVFRFVARAGLSARASAASALAYALNPVSILISGYHGQFDSLMLAPTLLAVYLLGTRRTALSALALGIGIWFKPVPSLLLPILLPRLASWRERAVFTVLALAPATLGTLPYFVHWPLDVATNFLGYSSWFGQWGLPVVWMVVEYLRDGTVPWWLPDPDYVSAPLHMLYLASRTLLLSALGASWWLIYRQRVELLRAISASFAVFYVATSGFGVQYLLWIVPFACARRDRWLWIFTLFGTILLLVAYSLGLVYLPLDAVPDNGPSRREFVVKVATLPTWIVCGVWAWSLLRGNGHYNRARTEQS